MNAMTGDKKMKTKIYILMLVAAMMTCGMQAQSAFENVRYRLEGMATTYHGDHNPLWLNANRYGLSSLTDHNGYLRAGVFRDVETDSLKKLGIGYGADIAVAHNFTSDFIVQQAYVEGRWLHGALTIGSREVPMEMKNQELSSGGQCFGINARPVPQVRISLPEYWNVPLTHGWLQLKGHIAYGVMTDGNWQQHFNTAGDKYQKWVRYHSKAGYLRLGDGVRSPLTIEGGLEMATLFGGKVTHSGVTTSYKSGLKEYVKAIIPFSDWEDRTLYSAEGDQLGSVMLSIGYRLKDWKLRAYADHFFEDGSSMYLLDYDGYGTGTDWNKHVKSRYLVYDPKDMLWGFELTTPKNRYVSSFVLEYIYTKYQSGPIYHDHSTVIPDHIGGLDGYYNHGTYTGWSHWGQVMGNPLYLSPIYNANGSLSVMDNRFTAWHFGVNGDPAPGLHYRMLYTTQKGWGTYEAPYQDVRKNRSFLAEVSYQLPKQLARLHTDGWMVKGALGLDHGELLGNNSGVCVSIVKTGILLH